MNIEIMDTTLRDGEQTSGVSFTDKEKYTIAKQLLTEVCVDRIEIASARVSKGEFEAVKQIMKWASKTGYIEKIEVLGFVDGTTSVDWIAEAGGKCINLLCKGSLKHLEGQLKKTPQQHINDIKTLVEYASKKGICTNIYLEDWSNGMRSSHDYVLFFIESLKDTAIKRYMIPDTLGILSPNETYTFCKEMVTTFPQLHFDFHGHNDYDLAVANTMMAIDAGVKGIHTSVNGLGERTGNTTLSSIVPALKDLSKFTVNAKEQHLTQISKLVEVISGIRVAVNKPIIGENVFTQTAGIHADGDNKGNLYQSSLMPERFGRTRKYALGKTSGKANIQKNLEELGLDLDQDTIIKVTNKVIELGDRKESITTEDLPYIISEILGEMSTEDKIIINNYYIAHAKGLKPVATLSLEREGGIYQATSAGDGQYDAYMNALKMIYDQFTVNLPTLLDYIVTIPPGGKTDALVETIITWELNGKTFKTRALDPDQTAAAIKATTKMLNILENQE